MLMSGFSTLSVVDCNVSVRRSSPVVFSLPEPRSVETPLFVSCHMRVSRPLTLPFKCLSTFSGSVVEFRIASRLF